MTARKRIAFCGHSHHQTTGSSAFILDLLRARADIVDFWDDGWLTGKPFDPSPLVAADLDAVVVWQVETVAEQVARAGLPNVTFFPMYDGCHLMPDSYWRSLHGIKVVCFSSTLHAKLQRLGVRCRHVRYAPDPERFAPCSTGPELAGYFWQRQQDVTWNTIRALLGEAAPVQRFTLHRALDPSFGELVAPPEGDVRRYGIRITEWFPSRAEAAADLARHNLYFAPRLREGIGMSFLEAMAMGFLVVAPDRPTMNEYVVSGVNGLLYDPDCPRPLDLDRRAELGARARQTIAQAHRRWERSVPALMEFVLTPTAEHPVVAPLDAFDPLAIEPCRVTEPPPPAAPAAPPDRPRAARRAQAALEGGRRLRLGPGEERSPAPLVTVAVVTRNAEATLPPTLDSILRQDFRDREVIVLDGASEDGTVGVVRRHEDALDYWRSEPDGGPYEAMNAAARLARGRFVLFMNAGDTFQSTDALTAALDGAPPDADVIFGHHVYRDVAGREELRVAADFGETWARLREGRVGWPWLVGVPGHQATLTRVEWLRANGYRTDLRIAADHDALYRLARAGGRFHHSMSIVATYVGGGLSSKDPQRCLAEWRRIALEFTDRPAAVAAAFDAMREDLRRDELPGLSTAEVLLRVGRVRGATRELRRRLKRSVRATWARVVPTSGSRS